MFIAYLAPMVPKNIEIIREQTNLKSFKCSIITTGTRLFKTYERPTIGVIGLNYSASDFVLQLYFLESLNIFGG